MANEKQSTGGAPLEARIAVLEELFVRLAQAGATEGILQHGFKSVSDQLQVIAKQMEPLRSLGPGVPQVAPPDDTYIRNLEAALISPQRTVKHWNGEPSQRRQQTLPEPPRELPSEPLYDIPGPINQRRTAS